jgi:hypothetical protein
MNLTDDLSDELRDSTLEDETSEPRPSLFSRLTGFFRSLFPARKSEKIGESAEDLEQEEDVEEIAVDPFFTRLEEPDFEEEQQPLVEAFEVPEETTERPRERFGLRSEKLAPAFWTITGSVSLLINVILIAVVIGLAANLFRIKKMVESDVLAGLYTNFSVMEGATIKATIPVNAEVPAQFDVPLQTDTVVILTEDTEIEGATVDLLTGGLVISNAPANIVLPKDTELPVHLDLTVPVDQMIPVNLSVEVDIPVDETELGPPISGLKEVVGPFLRFLTPLPNSWERALCGEEPGRLCAILVP